jgi:hypothetical protein
MMPNPERAAYMASPRRIWWDILLALTLLWIGIANLPTAVRLYETHRGTVSALLLIVSECLLIVGSGTLVIVATRAVRIRKRAPLDQACDWRLRNAGRLRILTIIGFLGLAWCLGALR